MKIAARILFIQTQPFAYPGLYYICGTLKSAGFEYDVLTGNYYKIIAKRINIFKPDIIGFPCMTGMHKNVLQIAELIKKDFPRSKILLGGIHPTLFPQIINNENVDFICRGEGEWPVLELLQAVQANSSSFNIPNISWKKEGNVHHNKMRPLINPLDDIPFPDYSIYSKVPSIINDTYPAVFMTRGCPFSCTYCHNSKQIEIYKDMGKYVRSFSIPRILNEVESAILHYPRARAVFLGADTLGYDINWLSELLTKYHYKFNIPYTCLIRPELINKELIKLLKKTNCHMIAFGVESGSERIKKEILKRNYTNEHVIQAANILRENGINFRTYNIVGYPTETREEMFSTLKLNMEIKAPFPWCSIYTPYPETKLAEFCVERGFLDKNFTYDDVPFSFFNDTILKNVDRNFILNIHSFFQIAVLFPRLFPFIKKLIGFKHNIFFKFIFKAAYSYVCIKSEKRSIYSFIRLALANRKFFK